MAITLDIPRDRGGEFDPVLIKGKIIILEIPTLLHP